MPQVETCGESFQQFDRYLNFSNPRIYKKFDPPDFGWAYGMNIFDLKKWKRHSITEVYHTWQKLVFGLLTKPLVRLLLSPPKQVSRSMISWNFNVPLLENGQDSEADMGGHNVPHPTSLRILLTTPSQSIITVRWGGEEYSILMVHSNIITVRYSILMVAFIHPVFAGRGFVPCPLVPGSPIKWSIHQLGEENQEISMKEICGS